MLSQYDGIIHIIDNRSKLPGVKHLQPTELLESVSELRCAVNIMAVPTVIHNIHWVLFTAAVPELRQRSLLSGLDHLECNRVNLSMQFLFRPGGVQHVPVDSLSALVP